MVLPGRVAAVAAIAAAAFFGLGMGLVAGLLRAPGWAGSLGGLALTQGMLLAAIGSGGPQRLAREGWIRSDGAAAGWLVLFLLVSIGSAVVWSVPAVRRALSGNRVVAGEPPSPLGARLLGAVIGLGGSSLIAAAAGVLLVGGIGATTLSVDIGQLAFVAGAVLLGGVSVAGGRGGFAGTALGVTLLCLVQMAILVAGGPRWLPTVVFALAILCRPGRQPGAGGPATGTARERAGCRAGRADAEVLTAVSSAGRSRRPGGGQRGTGDEHCRNMILPLVISGPVHLCRTRPCPPPNLSWRESVVISTVPSPPTT